MPTAPIPIASYRANLTMNFFDFADVRTTGDAVIQVIGGDGSINIPVAQGVQGFSMYAGATLPTATSPAGAVPMDKYTLTGTDGAGLPGDVYRKNGDNTWSLIGSIRGAAGHPLFVGTTVPTTTVPAGAATGDQYLYLGTSVGTTGDVYVKAADGSWSVSGNQRGPAGPSGAAQMQDRGNWAATTAYASGDVVTNGGFRWLVKTAHTSGATFSGTTNWISIGVAPETHTPLVPASGWLNYGNGFQVLGYETIGASRVFLRGVITNTAPVTTAGGPAGMFGMPTGLKPTATEQLKVMGNGTTLYRADLRTDGVCAIYGDLAANSYVTLSDLTYSTL